MIEANTIEFVSEGEGGTAQPDVEIWEVVQYSVSNAFFSPKAKLLVGHKYFLNCSDLIT